VELQHPSPEYLKTVYQALSNYLMLAVGSGMEKSFDFDLTGFCEVFNLEPMKTYHALKRMEEQGLIQLNEGFFSPSRLMFMVNKTELYKFEIAHARLEPYVKVLLRLYGGELMSHFINIEEAKIATTLSIGLSQVKEALRLLHEKEIVTYDPRKDTPQIIFLQPRQEVSKMTLDVTRIRERRENALEKMKVMEAYVTYDHTCRSLFISHYFGEEKSHPCGVCDICIERKHAITIADDRRMHEHILEMLKEETQTLENLVGQFGPDDEKKVLEVIRVLLDEGNISYTKDWKLSLD
jgi:ATP-dependent DNA helicase RecQ